MTDEEKNHQLYLDERKILIGLESQNNMELSKSIITLSTFSLGYIFYNASNFTDKTMMSWTCGFFLATILLVMSAFLLPNNMELSKSIITLSTFSLGYIFYNASNFTDKTMMSWTCGFFLATILLVMSAFLLGSRSLEKQIKIIEEYYLEDGALKTPWEKKIVGIISWLICITFILGLILMFKMSF